MAPKKKSPPKPAPRKPTKAKGKKKDVPRGTSDKGGNSTDNSTSREAGIARRAAALEANKWKPGQSGNPSGRPKSKPITEALHRAIARAIKGDRTLADALAEKAVAEALKGKLGFFMEIADRTEGKVLQRTDLSSEDGSMTPAAVPQYNILFRSVKNGKGNKK